MSQRVLDAKLIPECSNEPPDLVKPHAEFSAILAQQTGFDELGPRKAAFACCLDADHRRIDAPSTLAAVEPPRERAGAHSQNLGSVSKGVHRTAQGLHIHTPIMPDERCMNDRLGQSAATQPSPTGRSWHAHGRPVDHQHISAARALRELNRIRQVQLAANNRRITLTTRRTPLQARALKALGADTRTWDKATIT